MQLNFDPSYSLKFGEKHSFGLSALLTYQRFKAEGLLAFGGYSSAADKLSGNDFDSGFGVGFKLGRITSYNVCYTKLLRPIKLKDTAAPTDFPIQLR